MFLPFNDPQYAPLRSLVTAPADQGEDLNVSSTIKAYISEKNLVPDTKIPLSGQNGIITEWGDRMAERIVESGENSDLAKELAQKISLSVFTDVQDQITNNKIPGWSLNSQFKAQQIQFPHIKLGDLSDIAEKNLKMIGIDKPTRLALCQDLLDTPSIHQPVIQPALAPMNLLAEVADKLGKGDFKPGLNNTRKFTI